MKELVKITEHNGNQAVSARDLHGYLEINTRFDTWINRMFDYGFEEGLDFCTILSESTGGRPSTNYVLTLDCAKEISMLQRNDKGKEARKYFIEVEKIAKEQQNKLPSTYKEALVGLLQQIEEKEKIAGELEVAKDKIEQDSPKVTFANSVMGSSDSILIRDFAKSISDSDFKIGQNKLYEWLRDNKYLMKDNMPYQNYLQMGLFEVIERSIGSGVETFTSRTTKITGKGQVYFTKKIKKQ